MSTERDEKTQIATQQDVFLKHLMEKQIMVSIFLLNGIRLQGFIMTFDNYAVFIADQKRETPAQMIYKKNISTITLG